MLNDIDELEEEKLLLDALEQGTLVRSPRADEHRRMAEQAAKDFMRRDARINIRLSERDLSLLKKYAMQEGLPYQTLASSVIHKFLAGVFATPTPAATSSQSPHHPQ
jgi:predicted DNA binding CopG/RHH family protein